MAVRSLAGQVFSVFEETSPSLSTLSQEQWSHAEKRVYVSVNVMRAAQLWAGDLVLVKAALKVADVANVSVESGSPSKAKLHHSRRTASSPRVISTLKSAVQQQKNTPIEEGSGAEFVVGVAWPSHDVSDDSIRLSRAQLLGCELSEGDWVNVVALPPILAPDTRGAGVTGQGLSLPLADSIQLEILQGVDDWKSKRKSAEPLIQIALLQRTYVAQGHTFSVLYQQHSILVRIKHVGVRAFSNKYPSRGTVPQMELYVVTTETTIQFADLNSKQSDLSEATTSLAKRSDLSTQVREDMNYDWVGGLEQEIEQIRDLVELPLSRPDLYTHFGLTPPKGVLLHGPPGTGKSLLASIVAKSTGSTIFTVSASNISSAYHGEAERALTAVFEEAVQQSPSVIIVDELDALCPKREEGGEVDRRVVGSMLTCLDSLSQNVTSDENGNTITSQPRVMVIAATNRPNAIDPALRRPGRFDREIEIGIPSSNARLSILNVHLKATPHTLSLEQLESVANRTHGFVGADIRALTHAAGLIAIKRSILNPDEAVTDMRLHLEDVEAALLVTRPSAMREVFIETPKVAWDDIGGQQEVKQRLREAVEWPIKYPQTFKRLGIKPPRGVLLYGPPGCSKTLTARALASEGGLNFLSVKGSEVFSKYVGDSEKAIRDVFSKARAAAPSIIFLDEVDAIALSRGGDDGGGGTGDRVLTSLLTEMDGVEELQGVLVLAATNRPDVIDPALMRPGRLDRILYVGPPDLNARVEILRINCQKMAVAEDVNVDELGKLCEGCTGAEVVAVCQDAAMKALNEDFEAKEVQMRHFLEAARTATRRTTPDIIQAYEAWQQQSGVQSA